MGFFENNKNFIYIKLGSEMKGLTPEVKSEKFNLLKVEVNIRLKNFYQKLNSLEEKLVFYDEVFSWLGIYHFDYLMLNLFFEKEFSKIYSSIKNSYFIDNRSIIFSTFKGLLGNEFSYNQLDKIIKDKISEEFELNTNDWFNHELHNNPIVNKLADKLAENCEFYENFLNKILWSEKAWQLAFESNSPERKATIFLAKLTSRLHEKSEGKTLFISNYLKYKEERDSLFVDKIRFPIFYNSQDVEELNFIGVNVQKEKLNNIISEYLIIQRLSHCDYVDIFTNFHIHNKIMNVKAREFIDEKLDRGNLPSESDLKKIISLSSSTELKSLLCYIFRRTYLFEYD